MARLLPDRRLLGLVALVGVTSACQALPDPLGILSRKDIKPDPIEPFPTVQPNFAPQPTVIPTLVATPTEVLPTRVAAPTPIFDLNRDAVRMARNLVTESAERRERFSGRVFERSEGLAIQDDKELVLYMAAFSQKNAQEQSLLGDIKALDGDTVLIKGKVYDLRNPTQRIFAGAYLETYIDVAYKVLSKDLAILKPNLDTLSWLESKIQFQTLRGAPSLVPARSLIGIAPYLQLLDKNGKKFPKIWIPSIGEGYEKQSDTLFFNPLAQPISALAAYFTVDNPDKVKEFAEYVPGRKPETAFIEFLTSFLTSSQNLDNSIRYKLEALGKDYAEDDQKKYELMKSLLGFETLAPGVFKQANLKIGDIAEVWEYDATGVFKQGIALRPDETDSIRGLLFDGDKVKIIGEVPLRIDHDRQMAYEMVRVEVLKENQVTGTGIVARQYLKPLQS